MKLAFACLVVVGGCTADWDGDPLGTGDPVDSDLTGEYTVHRMMTGFEACPPYEEPIDFALTITSACAQSAIAGATCEAITHANGVLEFQLSERWNAGPGVPNDYPRYVFATVSYMLHEEGDALVGSAIGSYAYHTETTGDDCHYNWNVTATRN